jgi:ADP-ribose pyrophosphatase YjhB (NUDIX family)
MIEHHIQKEILQRLIFAPSLRFSELKPEGMESNIFMYHLKQLISQKFVRKTDDGYYCLSTNGMTYADGLSFKTGKPRQQPKVVSMIALLGPDGAWLLARRKVQPFIGKLMLISGKQHFGEDPLQHATRELHEKTGLEVGLRRRGLADIRTYAGDDIMTHITAHIYSAQTDDMPLPQETDRFVYTWTRLPADDTEMLPGTREVCQALVDQPDNLFFLSLDART